MRNLLALIGLAVVLFLGLGWYFHWYTFAVQTSTDGRHKVEFDVNTNKIAEDAKSAGQKVGQIIQDKSKEAGSPPTELVGPPAPTPAPTRLFTPPTAATPASSSRPGLTFTTPAGARVKVEDLPDFFRPSPATPR